MPFNEEFRKMMLRIKRVPTVVSNYQKDEGEEGGCGRNCLRSCCLPGNLLIIDFFNLFYFIVNCGFIMILAELGAKLPLYAFKKASKVDSLSCELGVEFLDSLVLGEVKN